MPEGDSLHRVARRLQPLVGERLQVEARHPRAVATGVAGHVDGRRLVAVEAVGKNLVLRFEGGVVLRSHLRMRGRWQVVRRGAVLRGRPWLVLRGAEREAVLWNGPVLELTGRRVERLGPDILADPPDMAGMIKNLRRDGGLQIGDALLDQRLVAGIGNLWRAEALWQSGISPWRRVGHLEDGDLERVLTEASRLMRASLETGREPRSIYRGRVCPRCGDRIRARGQGDGNRMAYWCPTCQPGSADRLGVLSPILGEDAPPAPSDYSRHGTRIPKEASLSTTDIELGPIDYLVVEWPADKQPTGEAMPLLVDLVDRGLIRVLDLAFLRKETDGGVMKLELTDLDLDGNPDLAVFEGASSGLLGQDDLDQAANALEPGCSAAILVYENTWAAPFATALRHSGAQLVANGRIPVNDIIAALDELEAAET